jgi:hypothetical protein
MIERAELPVQMNKTFRVAWFMGIRLKLRGNGPRHAARRNDLIDATHDRITRCGGQA